MERAGEKENRDRLSEVGNVHGLWTSVRLYLAVLYLLLVSLLVLLCVYTSIVAVVTPKTEADVCVAVTVIATCVSVSTVVAAHFPLVAVFRTANCSKMHLDL